MTLLDEPRTPVRLLAFAGSLRQDSWNRRLVHAAAHLASDGLRVEVYEDLQTIPLFSEDLEAVSDPKSVRDLKEAVARSDGLLISTPEYNHGIPGVLKNAIDWLSRPPERVLRGRPVAVLSATSGASGGRLAQEDLRHVFAACRSLVLPAPALHLADAASAFDAEGEHLVSDSVIESLERLLRGYEDSIRSWKPPRAVPPANGSLRSSEPPP